MQATTSHPKMSKIYHQPPQKPNLEERKKIATTITTSQLPPKNLTIKPQIYA